MDIDKYDMAAVIGALCKIAEELEKIRFVLTQIKVNASDANVELREQLRISLARLENA
jgi:hypothetical protein